MNSITCFAAIFAILLAVSLGSPARMTLDFVMAEASPAALEDPMITPTPLVPVMYLVQAGIPPFTVKPKKLESTSIVPICPKTFGRRGFSLKYDVNSSKVFFWLNRKPYRNERRMPFYLNGDRAGRIYSFRHLNSERVLHVGCKVPGKPEVWVKLVKVCKH